ncbi:MAG: elongation factor P [Planctomycetaceae bacterium]|jgi:elongation factor P|nr:elongation factor P [Planctomycetaceae bacterium]
MNAKEIKRGHVVVYNEAPCIIESVNVQTPSARGAATLYKFRARNLITRQKADITLKGTEALKDADFRKREVKFMYADANECFFLDQLDYNQYSLSREDISEEMQYISENLEGVRVLIYNDECVAVEIPVSVELRVTQCDPAVRGNSATSRTKPATLETGITVQVPEYLEEGELIKVDTRNGAFLSRAKD